MCDFNKNLHNISKYDNRKNKQKISSYLIARPARV